MQKKISKKSSGTPSVQPKNSQFATRPFVIQAQQNSQNSSNQAETENQNELEEIEIQRKESQLSWDLATVLPSTPQPERAVIRPKLNRKLDSNINIPIQAQLHIGQPNDKYEREADHVASQVVQKINRSNFAQAAQKKSLQCQEEAVEEIQAKPIISKLQRSPVFPRVQREAMPEEEELQTKSILQRQEAIGGGKASTELETKINSAKGSGQPLDADLQRSMGEAIGADFSGVKVHTDANSDHLNQSIQAKAFTTGQDIFFAQRQYNPGSTEGKELIAHELTHVVQQNSTSANVTHINAAPQLIQKDGKDQQKNEHRKFNPDQDAENIKQIFIQTKSWDTIKSTYSSTDLTTMWLCFDFRKYYVDSLISQLRAKYHGLIAKSVGSQDPTSDYDITISTPGSGDDVKAIEEFNNIIKAEFGVQPGTLFDTNLYAKDYLKVEENIDENSKKDQVSDTDLDEPEGGFGKMGGLSQDVASLVKQRRYMNQIEWNQYVEEVIASIDDKKQKEITRHQYEEADSIYRIAAAELRDEVMNNPGNENKEMINHVNQKTKLSNEEEQIIKNQPQQIQQLVKDELLGIKKLQEVTHENSDLVLEKSNKLYLQRMAKIREIQELIRILSPNEQENKQEIESLKAQVKQLLGEACFFAAEAYHSEGAVKHIVAGVQGAKKVEQKQQIMSSLKPEHYLQSFNEQFGDFLKDLNHYAKEPNGKIFYRASKYLYRLFLAVAELRTYKNEFKDLKSLKIENENKKTAEEIANDINNKLVIIRKGDKEFKGASEEQKITAAEKEMNAILQVGTASQLKSKIVQMAQEFNSEVRSKIKDLSAMDPEVSKQFFKNIY